MRRLLFVLFLVCAGLRGMTQGNDAGLQRPKLVVGIVVDQMRWDFLYRYYDRYAANGGFKRLLNGGFSCESTLIPYIPTVTASGHTAIYTGTVPAINGITGNDWWDYSLNKAMYCTQDDNEKTVGGSSKEGQMSPRSLLVTTIGDELRLATNFRSKVIGIALKDRAAILPAGHTANGAYWYEEASGNWITSSYYSAELPKWVQDLNAKKLTDQYYAQGWNTLYPLDTYVQSTPDVEPFEHKPFGRDIKGFPYDLKPFIGKNYQEILVTPFGNNITLYMARAAIDGEQLGGHAVTDMLTISLSSPDYIGHNFGPNSVEQEDDFLRLDKELGNFLDYLDQKLGKGNYLLFLTADHGAAQIPFFINAHNIPSGYAIDQMYEQDVKDLLKSKFGTDKVLIDIANYQVRLDRDLIKKMNLNKDSVDKTVIDYLLAQPAVYTAFPLDKAATTTLNETIKRDVINGYFPQRSGDIQIIYRPQWIENFQTGGTTHGAWYAYDSHIPLVWYGWKIQPGHSNQEVYMTDIAPTIAALLHIQAPNGSIGHVIKEVAP